MQKLLCVFLVVQLCRHEVVQPANHLQFMTQHLSDGQIHQAASLMGDRRSLSETNYPTRSVTSASEKRVELGLGALLLCLREAS